MAGYFTAETSFTVKTPRDLLGYIISIDIVYFRDNISGDMGLAARNDGARRPE